MKPALRSKWKLYIRNKVAGRGGALESRDGENERKGRGQGPWLGSFTFSVPLAPCPVISCSVDQGATHPGLLAVVVEEVEEIIANTD